MPEWRARSWRNAFGLIPATPRNSAVSGHSRRSRSRSREPGVAAGRSSDVRIASAAASRKSRRWATIARQSFTRLFISPGSQSTWTIVAAPAELVGAGPVWRTSSRLPSTTQQVGPGDRHVRPSVAVRPDHPDATRDAHTGNTSTAISEWTTGTRACRTNARNAAIAPEARTPPPARISGRSAVASR